MSGPGILTGGQLKTIFSYDIEVDVLKPLRRPAGVFAQNPGSTSKWTFNDSARKRDAEYRDSMARLFVELPPHRREDFLKSVSPESRDLAEALASGTAIGGGGGTGFFDFLLTNVQEAFAEKAQVVDTLTDNYVVYFSGREPTTASYAGTLLNTYQDDQRVWFFRLYNEMLRGTRLATRNLVAQLRYDSFLVSGYLTNLTLLLEGDTEHTASRFSFQMIIKRMQVLTPILCAPTGLGPRAEPETRSILEDAQTPPRIGEVTPEVPPTAVEGPAAEPVAAAETQSLRERLRAQGKSDASINQVYAASMALSVSPLMDPREEKLLMKYQGAPRVAEAATGTAPLTTNPANKQNDGVGGASNMTIPLDETHFLLIKNNATQS